MYFGFSPVLYLIKCSSICVCVCIHTATAAACAFSRYTRVSILKRIASVGRSHKFTRWDLSGDDDPPGVWNCTAATGCIYRCSRCCLLQPPLSQERRERLRRTSWKLILIIHTSSAATRVFICFSPFRPPDRRAAANNGVQVHLSEAKRELSQGHTSRGFSSTRIIFITHIACV